VLPDLFVGLFISTFIFLDSLCFSLKICEGTLLLKVGCSSHPIAMLWLTGNIKCKGMNFFSFFYFILFYFLMENTKQKQWE
jgi:hypothetical protein